MITLVFSFVFKQQKNVAAAKGKVEVGLETVNITLRINSIKYSIAEFIIRGLSFLILR